MSIYTDTNPVSPPSTLAVYRPELVVMESLVLQLKGIKGNDALLSLPPSATVKDLKAHLAADKGVPASDLSIIYKGTARQVRFSLIPCVFTLSSSPLATLSTG